MAEWFIIILKFAVVFAMAFLFGIERQRSHKPLGFGAFIFIAMGSCGLALTAMALVPSNPLALLSSIVSGIGFLGAGALIKSNDKLFGVTTASGIWAFAIIGMMMGLGNYLIAAIVYLSAWGIVLIDRRLERKGIGSYQRKIIITTNKIIHEKDIKNDLLVITQKFKLMELDVDSVPLNFLNPIAGTRLENQPLLPPLEILKAIAMFRFVLPKKEIRVCGGREANLRTLQALMYLAGANGAMTGNYLTTAGRDPATDVREILDLGLEPNISQRT